MNQKLTQLQEKITSLSADDLLYVSVNGVSRSIKASTVEAPLKAYADQKKSEVITEIEAVEASLNSEISNRIAADSSNLAVANAYADTKKSEVVALLNTEESARISADSSLQSQINTLSSADTTTLNSAKSYTDQKHSDAISAINSVDSDLDAEISRALSAEAALGVRIDGVLSNIDPAALDSLSEVVTAFQAADSDLNSAITSLATNLAEDIATEESARIAGDASTLSSANSFATSAAAAVAVPVGSMHIFAGTTAPTGYLISDGRAVSRSIYASLFTVVGTSFGSGDGSTTFNLPNPDSNVNLRYIIKF